MKPRPFRLVPVLALFFGTLLAGPRDAQWLEVENAITQRLPQTAIARLDPIIAGALADGSHAEATKAIARKITLEGEIQGNKPEELITRLEAEIPKASAAMRPMMEALLARWYWSFFNENRWQFMQRTKTATPSGADLRTWDLARILAEIDRHFTAALADDAQLKQTPINRFNDLLETGNTPERYRPTLYDFFANEALEFYQAGEHAAVEAADSFEIAASSPILADAAEFLQWQPATTNQDAPHLKAIKLYQALLRFHQADTDRSAYFDADLNRLTFGYAAATGEDKDARYQAALQRFAEATRDHEISARALALLAGQLRETDPARAREFARRGRKAFPASAGGAMCANVIGEIEAKSARIDTEFVWNAPWPTIDVSYRNVTRVYFRAVSVSLEQQIREGRLNKEDFKQELAAKPALAWNADLPPTKDFKTRTERLPVPTTLKPGLYVILASHDPAFKSEENQLSTTTVWVSNLALVIHSRFDHQPHRGFVLQAESGEPVAGANVRIWESKSYGGPWSYLSSVRSDADGRFELPDGERQLVVLAEHQGQAVSNEHPISGHRHESDDEEARDQTVFFTDRALYRPGQIVNYKGISLRSDQSGRSYTVLPREKIEVVFSDLNNQEVARATHVTNAYGSFSGAFTVPRDRVLGPMILRVTKGPEGVTFFRAEEYKRPKFEVKIAAPTDGARLGAPVKLTAKATAYTGAAIDGAKTRWVVMRQTTLSPWFWWRQTPATKTIAHGTSTTGADGSFEIEFTAAPDNSVPREGEPVFSYFIQADVTDSAGETRSAGHAVMVGYSALQATLTADAWQTPARPVEFAITTQSLDHVPQVATGTLSVHALQQSATVIRPPLPRERDWRRPQKEQEEDPASQDPSDPKNWAAGDLVSTQPFTTGADGAAKLAVPLKAGIYRVSLETRDRFGERVTARQTVEVVDPESRRYGVKAPALFAAPKWSLEPGEKFMALWGTGYPTGRAFVEIECDGKPLKSYWTEPGRTQQRLELPVTEAMRGGFTVRITAVRENRDYFQSKVVEVPWSNKELAVKWESFRSKLLPGQQETWTATITGPKAAPAAAEMVAALYDASLDQFQSHDWRDGFGVFRTETDEVNATFANSSSLFDVVDEDWTPESHRVRWQYPAFPPNLVTIQRPEFITLSAFSVAGGARGLAAKVSQREMAAQNKEIVSEGSAIASAPAAKKPERPEPIKPNLDQITARKNLNETAFFFPHLLSDANGTVKLQFTMPEALTRWKFLGFAHDKELRAGLLTGETVTAKDLMVQPNPPRFVREGDAIEFTVKVTNQTDQPQTGQVRLTFADAATLESVDTALGNRATEQNFEVPAKESRTYSWRVTVPDGMGFLTYKAVGATAKASDGEEGFLPVLSRRILLTESLPLPIRGKTTKEFDFAKLSASGQSDTLRHQSLTVQMVSQPAWYAVMALPYLMEYPYECSEQIFSRLYANALARHIANANPKIRRTFDLWKNTPALDSPLAKNEDLKSVMLEETPWLRQANKESEARRNVGLLFDANRLETETARTLKQLAERQSGSGLWSWFPGGGDSEYISLVIATGFGRLRHLGVTVDVDAALRSLSALDAAMLRRYQEIQRGSHPEKYVPSNLDALYLYGRSFFLSDRPIASVNQPAVDFFLQQARLHWTKTGSRQTEAHLALALQRFGDATTPAAIVKSLKERSVNSEELGMFWRDTERSWWWYHAPIETQALMIEVFQEVARDAQAVEDCQVWLLKQKQTQDWTTTRATADAIYALLLRGSNLLASDARVEVVLGGQTIEPAKVEAGTGFYEQKFVRDEIKPAMGHITVRKTDDGVSWGSVHWQYLEDMAKVTPHEGTPLTLKKALFVKENTKQGPVLKPVTGPIAVGDELVVRLELRTDRDMEYVHLKDQRGSGTEPVNVLSQYKYQDGLGYYESTRDTASHFFIDYLRKGTYVFEYSVRVQLRGSYQSGIAEIQCMYAPEFNSHSESTTIEVR